jgi:hypothetical protein
MPFPKVNLNSNDKPSKNYCQEITEAQSFFVFWISSIFYGESKAIGVYDSTHIHNEYGSLLAIK